MNILPHKSWHVRTQKNIARVKKDQAKAAEEEKEKQRRIALAAQEARTSFLRERAGQRLTGPILPRDVDDDNEGSTDTAVPKDEDPVESKPFALSADLTQSDGHINFFQEIEDGKRQESGVNADHEEEKKIEKEDYEKKIGLLVYLGQNSLEHSKDRPWYERVERSKVKDKEVPTTTDKDLKIMKLKDFQDPLKDIRSYLSSPGMKKKYGDLSGPKTRKIEFAAASTSTSTTTTLSTKRKASDEASEDVPKKKEKKLQKHKSKKHKHHKKHHKRSKSKSKSISSDNEDEQEIKVKKLEKLRSVRLEREREEKRKADKLLANLRGETYHEELPKSDQTNTSESTSYQPAAGQKQKYNSQFNPQLARQNFDNHYK